MARLFIFAGLPGSGKSTIARRLGGAGLDRNVISSETIREVVPMRHIMDPAARLAVHHEIGIRVEEIRSQCPSNDVIVDTSLVESYARYQMISRFRRHYYVVGIFPCAPRVVIFDRTLRKFGNKRHFDPEVFDVTSAVNHSRYFMAPVYLEEALDLFDEVMVCDTWNCKASTVFSNGAPIGESLCREAGLGDWAAGPARLSPCTEPCRWDPFWSGCTAIDRGDSGDSAWCGEVAQAADESSQRSAVEIRLSVKAVIFSGSQVMLVRRRQHCDWALPSGGVEPGETKCQALRREVYEETGLNVLRGQWGEAQVGQRFDEIVDNALIQRVSFVYLVDEHSGALDIKDTEEIAEARWFPVEALPSDLAPTHRMALAQALSTALAAPDGAR